MESKGKLSYKSLFPNAESIFNLELKSLEEICHRCLFVIDTNVLLLPYTVSNRVFEAMEKTFTGLVGRKQLIIPAQVAREFAYSRPEKISDLFQQLHQLKALNQLKGKSVVHFPVMENSVDFKEVIACEGEVLKVVDEYLNKLERLIDIVKGWASDDPVSLVYRKLFDSSVIFELYKTEEEIVQEQERRIRYNIPLGSKNGSGNADPAGDLILWLTILQMAKEKDKDIVLVTDQEKADWLYRSGGEALFPRIELIAEFKAVKEGRSFHIIKLSDLLALYGADAAVVDEVKKKERETCHHSTKPGCTEIAASL